MSAGWVLVLIALAPAAGWLVAAVVTAARSRLRRRGDEATRRRRLARMLGRAELVLVPTGDVDLPEIAVRETAADAGYRFLGYERGRDPFRRRVGVFVRVGGGVDAVITGSSGARGPGPGSVKPCVERVTRPQ